jgi:hypothetical protein
MVSVEALAKVVDPGQLTPDLNGNLAYDHQGWLEMRIAVEDCMMKTKDLLDSYDNVKEKMEDLVSWLDDWKWDGPSQAKCHGLDYLKERLQRHTDIRKRIRYETVEQLKAHVHNTLQK